MAAAPATRRPPDSGGTAPVTAHGKRARWRDASIRQTSRAGTTSHRTSRGATGYRIGRALRASAARSRCTRACTRERRHGQAPRCEVLECAGIDIHVTARTRIDAGLSGLPAAVQRSVGGSSRTSSDDAHAVPGVCSQRCTPSVGIRSPCRRGHSSLRR